MASVQVFVEERAAGTFESVYFMHLYAITSSLSEKPTVFAHNSNSSVGYTLKTLQVNYKIQSHVVMDSPILNRELQKKIFHWRGKHKVRCKYLHVWQFPIKTQGFNVPTSLFAKDGML